MDNADYHAHPAISKSHLDLIARSPLHYWARYVDPARVVPEPTAAMRLGTALHTHVLELSRWDAEIAVAPNCDRRTKSGKEAFAAFEADSAGKTVITADDAEVVMAMGRSIMRHPGAAMLLGMDGKAETTHMWTDATYGLQCKCRPDWLTDDGSIVVDLKTTRTPARAVSDRASRHSGIGCRLVGICTGLPNPPASGRISSSSSVWRPLRLMRWRSTRQMQR